MEFLKFYPGLVGGHCVGVDPYYLIQESKRWNINPELMVSARKINNSMTNKIRIRIEKKFKKKMQEFFYELLSKKLRRFKK